MRIWFVGVNLAWSERLPSGVAILEGGPDRPLRYVSSSTHRLVPSIAAPILELDGPMWVAIDGPIVVRNEASGRPVDIQVARRYSRFDVGAHAANLNQMKGNLRGERLLERLAPRGVRRMDAVTLPPQAEGSWAFETFSHPAMVELFGLDRIIKYKKAGVGEKREGVGAVAGLLAEHLPRLDPPLALSDDLASLLHSDASAMRGRGLQAHEDRLDALLSAYVAAHVWHWGAERNWSLGSAETGSTVLPMIRTDVDHSPAP
jgi:predicted RNase H-like nuclease